MVKSKALEVNIADYYVDVDIDTRYSILQEVMNKYFGLMEGLNVFLKELSHPYKNWSFIVIEARKYSLEYLHLLQKHERGPEAAALYIDVFVQAIVSAKNKDVKSDAADNLILFLQKIITDSKSSLDKFIPVLNRAFDKIRGLDKDNFFLFIKSYYPVKRLAESLLQRTPETFTQYRPISRLVTQYIKLAYDYWLTEDDPKTRFIEDTECESECLDKLVELVKGISHDQIQEWQNSLNHILASQKKETREVLVSLLELPGFNQVVKIYRKVPQNILDAGDAIPRNNYWKILFLFHIMNISGLSGIYEETLRDINRTLTWIIANESYRHIQILIKKTFSILKERADKFPDTALNCVMNMGKGVYQTDDVDLVNFYIDSVIDLGFQSPMIKGIGNDWQVQGNSSHIKNVRTWIEIIKMNPKWSTRLLTGLIIHLSLSGVFIRDIDLFPRDITQLLNSGIEPVYNIAKQLARLFPVYFNDIGAEGKLRDISTEIDEISHRKDILIHFLRKQSHVESSNRVISLLESTLAFWETGDKKPLKPYLPPNLYKQIRTKGPYIDGVRRIASTLSKKGIRIPGDFLTDNGGRIEYILKKMENTTGVTPNDIERVSLAVTLYQLLYQKYNFDFIELDTYIGQLRIEGFPQLKKLEQAITEPDIKSKTFLLLDYLEMIKGIILSEDTYEIREDIYKKRHITVDIPSMYGSYHEMKFDSLGLTFRIESMINVLFGKLIDKIDLSLITRATFYQIYDLLMLFNKALKLDGIVSAEIERQLDFLAHSLEARGFTFTQYLDIFKGFALAVKNIFNDHFNNIFEQNLLKITSQLSEDQILPKYLSRNGSFDSEKLYHRISEIFFRDKIALSLGLQQLDLFLSRILKTLFDQADKLPSEKLRLLLNYDPKRALMSLLKPKSLVSSIISLGNKGVNLLKLKNFRFPVPPGFIITTEIYRCREIIDGYIPAEQNLRDQIQKQIFHLEKVTGKTFNKPRNPLLFSVRSGSSISQPGMMDTFLNVGINEDIVSGIAEKTGNLWFAWDNYRRFLQCYGMAYNMERDVFDAIISEFKQKAGIQLKSGFSGKQMREIALAYKALIKDHGIDVVEDPFEQLYLVIKSVFDSWVSAKAMTYRRIMGISDDWGTAVTVQAMVFGNISMESGTGVFFTHNPRYSGDTLKLWGDFSIGNQGEDVVSGLVNTLPISLYQQEIEMRDTDITLETHFPEIYNALKTWAMDLIYDRRWSPQEIEFTFESPRVEDLYILQTRDMAMRERKKVATFDITQNKNVKYLGHGIGVSGGAMSGRLVFTLDEIERWRQKEPDTYLILVRGDTVPDDIREIHATDGLLTARGGVTSHASVVVHRLGKTCVVGCGNLVCNETEKDCFFDKVPLKSGDFISLDGQEGSVYKGVMKVNDD